MQWEEPSALSDDWQQRELWRMRLLRLSSVPELVARGSFEGAQVEGKRP